MPVTDVTQYRKRDLPVHIINADVLQSALLSEARVYSDDENVSAAGAHRFKIRFAEKPDEAPENTEAAENSDELIDDYTGPADAKERGARPAHDDARADNSHACNGREHGSAHFGVAHCGIRLQCQ